MNNAPLTKPTLTPGQFEVFKGLAALMDDESLPAERAARAAHAAGLPLRSIRALTGLDDSVIQAACR